LPPREEEECALRAEKKCYADKEEDVAHGEKGSVKEEDDAEDEEEDTYSYVLAIRGLDRGWNALTYRRLRRLRRPLFKYMLAGPH
jgi:hypothetical protein